MILNPKLAAHVEILEIRNWGGSPTLEDYNKGGWGDEPEEDDEDEDDDEDNDEDENEDEDEVQIEDIGKNSMKGSDNTSVSAGELDETYSDDYDIFQQAAQDLGFENDAVNHYQSSNSQEVEDILLVLLLSRLPNLHTLHMEIPENSLQWLITKATRLGKMEFLKCLKKVCLCHALRKS
jgi:hypothetical protein